MYHRGWDLRTNDSFAVVLNAPNHWLKPALPMTIAKEVKDNLYSHSASPH